ncbi:MAG: type II secretion system protein GspK [Zavarzinia sp.]|nr:type II secretion system protein GspK [Zavarzinia sp.]
MTRAEAARRRGFALPAAVAGVAAFALIALAMVDWGRGVGTLLQARADVARLEAAAEAGLALAIHGAGLVDARRRWPADGSTRRIAFQGVDLAITVENERGFVPLNAVTTPVLLALFSHAGAASAHLSNLAAELEDWRDADDETRPGGAEKGAYAAVGIIPRNGPLREAGELALLRGMDAALLARLLPLISLVPRADMGMMDGRGARPEVLAIMAGVGPEEYEAMRRARAGEGTGDQTPGTPEDPAEARALFRITVEARLAPDGMVRHQTVVEFTGDPRRPYWIRSYR